MKYIPKNKHIPRTMVCSHEVLDVLDHSSYDNRIETRTKLQPVHNASSNAVPFVIHHMQSEQQHFQTTRSDYDKTGTPRFPSCTFSFRYLKSHSEPALSFLLGGLQKRVANIVQSYVS